MASSSHSTIHRGGEEEDDDVDVGAGADEPQPQPQPKPKPKPRLKPTTSSKVPTHLFKSLSTREPSFSDLTFSPARFSTPSSPCSPTPLHHKPLSFNNHTSHRCISSTLNKDRQILSIALSGPLVYTGSQASTIRIWKLPDFSEVAQLKANKAAGAVRSLAVSDDRLFAGYADCKIRVWRRSWDGLGAHVRLATIPNIADYLRSYITGKDHKNIMKQHLGAISSLAINTADDLLYSVSVDTTVKVWRISKLKCIETIRAHMESINAIVVGEDGVFYTASDDATVRVWRRHSYGGGGDRPHSLAVTLSTDSSPVKALALTADGMVLYGGCTDGYVHCWLKGWLSGHMHYGGPLQGHRHAVLCLACMSNYLVSGSADLTCRVWVRDGEGLHTCLAVLEGHMGPVRCVAAFAADGLDGCMVCTASLDGTLKIWRVTSSGNVSLGPTQGFEFDYIFDWTIIKYQQSQRTKAQPHRVSPVGTSNRAIPMEVDKCQGRNDVSYSAEFTNRMGSRNAAHPGVRMQFRSATNKNLSGDDPHTEKNKVGTSADQMHMPSTAFSLSDVSKKNSTAMKQALPTEAAYIGQGGGNAIGTSSSWLPSFHRSSSAK